MQIFTSFCIRNDYRLPNLRQHDCVILKLLFNVIFLHSTFILLKQKSLKPGIMEHQK